MAIQLVMALELLAVGIILRSLDAARESSAQRPLPTTLNVRFFELAIAGLGREHSFAGQKICR